MSNSIKCDLCGQFIPYGHLDSGCAKHVLVTPDSEYTEEAWETTCAKCLRNEKAATE